MSDENPNGPAFPVPLDAGSYGLTRRQYACIKLKVPDSGLDWLDELIEKSLLNDFAGQAMAAILGSYRMHFDYSEEREDGPQGATYPHRDMYTDSGDGYAETAEDAYAQADAMLAERHRQQAETKEEYHHDR